MKKHDAISFYGSAAELARALGIEPQAISQWGEYVPRGRAYELQYISGGKLKVDRSSYLKKKSVA